MTVVLFSSHSSRRVAFNFFVRVLIVTQQFEAWAILIETSFINFPSKLIGISSFFLCWIIYVKRYFEVTLEQQLCDWMIKSEHKRVRVEHISLSLRSTLGFLFDSIFCVSVLLCEEQSVQIDQNKQSNKNSIILPPLHVCI